MEAFEVVVCCVHIDKGTPVNVLTCVVQPGDQVLSLKQNIEGLSAEGTRPVAQQVLVCWGEELQDDTVLSQLEPQPSSIVVMMRSTEPELVQTIDMPEQRRALDADALFQMIRQASPAMQPPGPLPEADAASVTRLVEILGCPNARASKALLLNGNNVEAAMEWLLNHSDDPDIDVPLTPMQLHQMAGGGGGLLGMMGMRQMLAGGAGGMPAASPPAAAASPQTVSPEIANLLAQFEPLLKQVAAVAKGDGSQRAAVEQQLPVLQERGWKLSDAIQQLWQGERDPAVLSRGVDTNSASLIRRMLELTAAS